MIMLLLGEVKKAETMYWSRAWLRPSPTPIVGRATLMADPV